MNENDEMIKTVALGLQEFNHKVVFVGGVVAHLYVTNPNSVKPRVTNDVDCVVEITTLAEQLKFEMELRKKGFTNDISENGPRCRWIYKGIRVGLMATEQKVSGLKSIWFPFAMRHIQRIVIDDECTIRVFEFPYYLAIKCEAYFDRGIADPWLSKDLEDIVYLLINRKECYQEIANSPEEVRLFILSFFKELIRQDYFNELIDSMVRGSETLAMIKKVKELWEKISRMS